MDTWARLKIYQRRGKYITDAQRRRLAKKAHRDPRAHVERFDIPEVFVAKRGIRHITYLEAP